MNYPNVNRQQDGAFANLNRPGGNHAPPSVDMGARDSELNRDAMDTGSMLVQPGAHQTSDLRFRNDPPGTHWPVEASAGGKLTDSPAPTGGRVNTKIGDSHVTNDSVSHIFP